MSNIALFMHTVNAIMGRRVFHEFRPGAATTGTQLCSLLGSGYVLELTLLRGGTHAPFDTDRLGSISLHVLRAGSSLSVDKSRQQLTRVLSGFTLPALQHQCYPPGQCVPPGQPQLQPKHGGMCVCDASPAMNQYMQACCQRVG
jgi:hypothetical protein